MKNYKSVIVLFFLSINIFFISCENEPIDPALLVDHTVSDCSGPETFSAGNFIGNTVKLSWTAADDEGSWVVQYGPEGFVLGTGTMLAADGVTELTINNLSPDNEYSFYIRTVCNENSLSSWIGPISVGESVVICPSPTALTAVRNAANTSEITVSWIALTPTVSWEIQYGNSGFTVGTGTSVTSTVPTKTINGLLATSAYEFYVRTSCSDNQNSGWVGPILVNAAGVTPPSSGDYWPTAINNQWVYNNSNDNATVTMKIVSTNVVNGNTYYTLAPPQSGPSATQRIRKSNGDYFIRTEEISIPANGPVPASTTTGNEILILKDYLAVGQSWNQSYVQTTTYGTLLEIAMNVSNVSTIEELGGTQVIGGVTYNNVIKMKQVATYTGTMTPLTVSTNTYWFAKDIGIIKIQVVSDSGDGYLQELVSYQLF